MKTLSAYLKETNADPHAFFVQCYGEINRVIYDIRFVHRDFIMWQRDPTAIPFYVFRHFQREWEAANPD